MPSPIKNYLMFTLPFANDIANALTISKIRIFSNLYKPYSIEPADVAKSEFIDSIALFGIIWNVSFMASKHGTRMGVGYGMIVLLLSFIIPNALMEPTVNHLSDKKIYKTLGAFAFILILLFIEIKCSRILHGLKWKYSRFAA